MAISVNGKGLKSAPTLGTLKIPNFTGAQTVAARYQRRTQLQYVSVSLLGLLAFYQSLNAKLRTLGLSVLFPGAGFLAVGGIGGIIGLILSLAVFPLSLFAWFGAGGLGFVIANWIIPGVIATLCVGANVWEPSGAVSIVVVIGVVTYTIIKARIRSSAELKLREERNIYLEKADSEYVQRIRKFDDQTPERELSLQEVKMLQRFVEIAQQTPTDWSGFNVVDQFQTSALRYQLYDMQYTLAFVQKYYLSSFRGYVKSSQEKLIEKSLTKPVMNYWKWESLWGRFSLDWDPVLKDNIMVTGYLLLCLSLYEKLNEDSRYTKDGALKFDITSRRSYRHCTLSIMNALMENWKNGAYCLFPCEPNWIYSGCNLIGIQGALAYDSYMHTGQTANLLQGDFHRQFEREFMNLDGSIVALRSATTGFSIPGLAGVLGDIGGAHTCSSSMPLIAKRLWHVSREKTARKNAKTGKWTIENLVGADKMDVGNYQAGPGFAYSIYASCAGEFGEEDLRNDLVEYIDTRLHPIQLHDSATGSLKHGGLSLLASGYAYRARLMKRNNWHDLVNDDIDSATVNGPKLADVPFPAVLVAKCATPNGKDLDMVLYDGINPGTFKIQFSNLTVGAQYTLNGEVVLVDGNGKAECDVNISGRTPLSLIGVSA